MAVFALSVAVVVFSGGCLSGPAQSTEDGDETATQNVKPVPVAMRAAKFTPQALKVSVGATVEWVNDDAVPHDVTAGDKSWQSAGGMGGMNTGAKYSKTWNTAGTYQYYCSLHSTGPGNGMWGKITVERTL